MFGSTIELRVWEIFRPCAMVLALTAAGRGEDPKPVRIFVRTESLQDAMIDVKDDDPFLVLKGSVQLEAWGRVLSKMRIYEPVPGKGVFADICKREALARLLRDDVKLVRSGTIAWATIVDPASPQMHSCGHQGIVMGEFRGGDDK